VSGAHLHHPAGSLATGSTVVSLTPKQAGWSYSGLRVHALVPAEAVTFSTGGDEMAVLPLAGSLTVEVENKRFALSGRTSVFARVTDWAYLPIDAEVRLTGGPAGTLVALCTARATRRFEPAYVAAESVPVELRGAGPATRQVNNFMAPGVFDGADKLMCVELLTPDGNWSSYPPHRHDGELAADGTRCTTNNEEIYYFRIGRTGSTEPSAEGFGMHRTYTADGEIDVNLPVRDGDVFLVPRGYHGPCIAAPGYPMYYLNVLAGPAGERTMAFCDDPTHHWVRATWDTMPTDPRCPMTSAAGLVG
jgi:5-deoxy-glucuronate isomerase